MYKCNNCNDVFSQYDKKKDILSGEILCFCPHCYSMNFDEIQQRNADDEFLVIEKSAVIDFVVTAIAFLNQQDIETAKETLTELIGEMVDSPFEYKDELAAVSVSAKDKLIGELQIMVEVKKV